MATITTQDGAEIFYKDWGPKIAQPIVFHHGWARSADDWDTQMMFFLLHGYRVVAHDRRGHGRSSQVATGHDMDHYASDSSAMVRASRSDQCDPYRPFDGGWRGGTLCCQVRPAPGARGQGRADRGHSPADAQDGEKPRAAFRSKRSTAGGRRWLRTGRKIFSILLRVRFTASNRPGAKVSQGIILEFWRQGMMGGALAQYEEIKAYSETDQTDDLKAITVPTLVMQGDDDQLIPYKVASSKQAELLKNSTLKIYPGFPTA